MAPEKRLALLDSDEGRILLAGIGGWLLYFLGILLIGFVLPGLYKLLTAITVSHIIIGRVAGISVGFAMEASTTVVVAVNMLIETLLVLTIYPLFIMSWNKLHDIGRFEGWIAQARANAERYRPKIEKYGIIGLFLFVWFPFWMTGPVVGSMIGYLMGFRHRVTLSVVLAGTLIAIACWAFFLESMQAWALALHPEASWLVVVLVLFLVMIGFILRKWLKR